MSEIVASVSAIYGLGDPEMYRQRLVTASVGEERGRDALLEALVGVQYQRNDTAFERGTFRVRGDTIEVFPAYDEQAVRVEFWGDTVERITKIDPLTGNTIAELAGSGRDLKAKIDFDDEAIGRKTLVVAQANLERDME